jgi:hypothetical protein
MLLTSSASAATRAPARKEPAFEWGSLRGELALPPGVLTAAAARAKAHYGKAEAEAFCGDPVEDYRMPAWMSESGAWLPVAELKALGFRVSGSAKQQLLATVGVEAHVDAIHGPVLIVALYNDGLTFRQGRTAHKTQAGKWFVFDDRKPHSVRETTKSTTYLCWSVPLVALED